MSGEIIIKVINLLANKYNYTKALNRYETADIQSWLLNDIKEIDKRIDYLLRGE